MTEITVNKETTYSIDGLSALDLEMIGLGLDTIVEPSMVSRKDKLLAGIDGIL